MRATRGSGVESCRGLVECLEEGLIDHEFVVLFQHNGLWGRSHATGKGCRDCYGGDVICWKRLFSLKVMLDDAYVCCGGYWIEFVPVEDCYSADAPIEDTP